MNCATDFDLDTATKLLPLPDDASSPLILLVEDDPVIQKVHRLMLEKIGYTVDIASNGPQALAMLDKKYSAILMDVGLPDISGIEITTEIRRLEGSKKHVPIIALTAYVCEETKWECLAAGADEVATKPIKIEALATILRRWASK